MLRGLVFGCASWAMVSLRGGRLRGAREAHDRSERVSRGRASLVFGVQQQAQAFFEGEARYVAEDGACSFYVGG